MDPNEQPPPATPDAPNEQTMEQIRRRRLERLTGPPSSSPSPAPSRSEVTKSPVADPGLSSNNFGKNSSEDVEAAAASVEIRRKTDSSSAASGSLDASRKRPATQVDSPSVAQPRKQPTSQESIEDYTNRVLIDMFHLSVNPGRLVDSRGADVTFLPTLSHDLESEGAPLRLPVDRLEEALFEAATAYPPEEPLFNYFLQCWKRVNRTIKVLRKPAPQKEEVLKEARRLCFSNCIFSLTMPELFGYALVPISDRRGCLLTIVTSKSREPNAQHDTLVPYLLRGVEHSNGLCMDFFGEAVTRLEEDETIAPLFTKAMADISATLSTLNMNDNYKPYLDVSSPE